MSREEENINIVIPDDVYGEREEEFLKQHGITEETTIVYEFNIEPLSDKYTPSIVESVSQNYDVEEGYVNFIKNHKS